jgi:hypothetical protein
MRAIGISGGAIIPMSATTGTIASHRSPSTAVGKSRKVSPNRARLTCSFHNRAPDPVRSNHRQRLKVFRSHHRDSIPTRLQLLKAFRSRQERPESLCNRCGRSPKVRMCCCDKSQMAGSEHVQELREEADQIDLGIMQERGASSRRPSHSR